MGIIVMCEQSDDNVFFRDKILCHYSFIVKFLIRYSRDEWVSSDIAQSVMEQAWKYIKRMRSYDNVKKALLKIAKNDLKKYYKKHPSWVQIEGIQEIASPDETIEEIVIVAENVAEFKRIFHSLDEKYASILILHHYYELPLRAIAKTYGINYNTIVSWHSRALKKLKEGRANNDGQTGDANK